LIDLKKILLAFLGVIALFTAIYKIQMRREAFEALRLSEESAQNRSGSRVEKHSRHPQQSDELPSTRSSNRESKGANIRALEEFGYEVKADIISDYSAEGSVELLSPEGHQIWGDQLVFSSSDNRFYLIGHVKMEMKNGEHAIVMSSLTEEAYVAFSLDEGRMQTSKSGWSLGSLSLGAK